MGFSSNNRKGEEHLKKVLTTQQQVRPIKRSTHETTER
jgi:hypothetical protein